MSTVKKDRDGNVLEETPGTKYHPDGTGPRNADGSLIRHNTTAHRSRRQAAPAPAPTGAGKTKGS